MKEKGLKEATATSRTCGLTKVKMLTASKGNGLLVFLAVGLAVGVVFADGSLTWNGTTGASWNGVEQNWFDGGTPSAWVDGADATFSGAASVTLGGTVVVSNLTTTSTLAIDGTITSTDSLTSSSATLVFPGCTLDDIEESSLAADLIGSSIGGYKPAKAYHYTRSGQTAKAQFQAVHSGHLRCMKVKFTETSDGITAQIDGSKSYYVHKNDGGESKLGEDIDNDPTTQTWGLVTTPDGTGGIGICNLSGVRPRVKVAGSVQLGGAVALTNAIVEVVKPVSQTLGQPVSGSNSGLAVKGLPVSGEAVTFGITDPSVGGSSASWLTSTADGTVFTNMVLSPTIVESAVLRGSYIGSDTYATPYFITYDGETLTCQLQAAGSNYVRGPVVELKQVGANVHARWVQAYFLQPGKLGDNLTAGAKYSRDQYGVKSLTLRPVVKTSFTYNGSSSVANMVVDCAQMVLKNRLAYPAVDLVARNAAQVLLVNGGSANDSGSGKTYTFESGSSLWAYVTGGTDGMANYVFDNSMLYAPLLHSGWQDGNTYVRYLTLKNGSRTVGNPLRCGGVDWMEYVSDGTGTNVLGTGVNIFRWSSGASTKFYLTTHADMEVSGRIQEAPDSSYKGTPIIKRGDAALILSGTNSFTGRLTVEAGTVALASDTALPVSTPITLKGGTVTCGAGVTNTTGVLTLSGNATINLGSGALAFADSSSATWAEGATLTITGTEPLPTKALQFGTSKDGLDYSQLRKITYNGERVSLDAHGYLSARGGIRISIR